MRKLYKTLGYERKQYERPSSHYPIICPFHLGLSTNRGGSVTRLAGQVVQQAAGPEVLTEYVQATASHKGQW